MNRIERLSEIADQYDLFLVDQFGVLHDGRTAYPGAIDGLAGLASNGCKIVVLTNSGKGAAENQARLNALGFPSSSFDAVVSSGQVALRLVKERALGRGLATGAHVFVLGRAGDTYAFSSEDFILVDRPEDAAVLVFAGSDAPRTSLSAYRSMLGGAALAGVPAICANPDITMLRDGVLVPAPGAIAKMYEELGGLVEYVGKPQKAIFEHALGIFEQGTAYRVLMIGDSPQHDVAGARSMGFSTLLVRTGVQAHLREHELFCLCAENGGLPDYLIPDFRW